MNMNVNIPSHPTPPHGPSSNKNRKTQKSIKKATKHPGALQRPWQLVPSSSSQQKLKPSNDSNGRVLGRLCNGFGHQFFASDHIPQLEHTVLCKIRSGQVFKHLQTLCHIMSCPKRPGCHGRCLASGSNVLSISTECNDLHRACPGA